MLAPAVLLSLDPAKKSSGAAIFHPVGSDLSLDAWGIVRTQAERERWVVRAKELGEHLELPVVIVAEMWDKPRHRKGKNAAGETTTFDQKWNYKTILGMGEGWGKWTAEFERHDLRAIYRLTPNQWRGTLFGKHRPRFSGDLAIFACNFVQATFNIALNPETEHDIAVALCIGMTGARLSEVKTLAIKETKRLRKK